MTENFSVIPITKGTLGKIRRYGQLMKGIECYGYLLAERNKTDGVVTEAILAYDQEVSGGRAEASEDGVSESWEEVDARGCKSIGIWHNHGHHGAFHSDTDDKLIRKRGPSLAGNNEEKLLLIQEFSGIVDGAFEYRKGKRPFRAEFNGKRNYSVEENNEDIRSGYFCDENGLLTIYDGSEKILIKDVGNIDNRIGIKGFNIGNVGASYSIVVTDMDGEYGEICVKKWCNIHEQRSVEFVENCKLKVVPGELNISDYNLEVEIKRKVKRSIF